MKDDFIIHTREKLKDYKETSKLEGIRTLIIRQNMLKNLNFMDGCKTLIYAEFHDNIIEKFETLSGFPRLKVLDLGFNLIRNLPNPIHKEGTLEELYLPANKLSKIECIENLKYLKILEMGRNFIEKIENLEPLQNLTELWLGANNIRHIKGIPVLPKLQILSLQANKLTEIENLPSLISLEQLLLSENKITNIQIDFQKYPKLNILDISDNPLKSININSSSLEMIWINKTEINDITSILKIPTLKYINIQQTPIIQDTKYILKLKETYKYIEIYTGMEYVSN